MSACVLVGLGGVGTVVVVPVNGVDVDVVLIPVGGIRLEGDGVFRGCAGYEVGRAVIFSDSRSS